MNKLQPINGGGVVSSQPSSRPIRPVNINLGNGIRPTPTKNSTYVGNLPHVIPNTPCNTPNNPPEKPNIVVSDPDNQIVTSQIAVDSDSKVGTSNPEIVGQPIPSTIVEHETETIIEQNPEENKFSTTLIAVDSASNADKPPPEPIGQKMETTITSSATSSKTENNDGNISTQTTIVTSTKTESSKSEFHSVTSSTNKVTLSSSEEPIGEIISQIVNDSFNKNAAETKSVTVATASNDDKKKEEEKIEHYKEEPFPFPPVYIAVCPAKPPSPILAVCPAKPPTPEPEIRKSQEENQNDREVRPASTFEAFKNFVGGIMSSAVNAVSPQSEKIELKFEENKTVTAVDGAIELEPSKVVVVEGKADSKIEDTSKPKGESVIGITQIVTKSSDDIGLSSPGLVKEIISSKIEIIPSQSKDENEVISSSVTKESNAFIELPNGFHKEESTSTVTVTSSHPSLDAKTNNENDDVISSDVKSSGPVIVELSTSAYHPTSEPETSEFKSAYEESHTACSSLETTASSTYYEVSTTSYESATEHFSSSHEGGNSYDHVDTHDSSGNDTDHVDNNSYDSSSNDTHDYSSFDVD